MTNGTTNGFAILKEILADWVIYVSIANLRRSNEFTLYLRKMEAVKFGRRRQPTLASVDTYSCSSQNFDAVNESIHRSIALYVSPGFSEPNLAYTAAPSPPIVTSFMGRKKETCIPPCQHHSLHQYPSPRPWLVLEAH